LAVGVEDPEGGVDTDPEGVRARRGRTGCRRGVESIKGEAGDGNGLGGTFEDLRKARWCQQTSLFAMIRGGLAHLPKPGDTHRDKKISVASMMKCS
jgi:hypothetical protein